MFVRQDWTLFTRPHTLAQKAGVEVGKLPLIVCKELVDNALDAGASPGGVSMTLEDGVLTVCDDGPGIPGTNEEIAHLFSVARPLTSTKLLRLPTRGALGNGLRVVVGAVIAFEGGITVATNGRRLVLQPQHDGTTKVISSSRWRGTGTEITVALPKIGMTKSSLVWGDLSITEARVKYSGKTCIHWYDDMAFHELLLASGDMLVQDLIRTYFRATKAGMREILAQVDESKQGHEMSLDDARKVMTVIRAVVKPMSPEKLVVAPVGAVMKTGTFTVGTGYDYCGTVPVVVEATAVPSTNGRDNIFVFVNDTVVTEGLQIYREGRGKKVAVYGAGLSHNFTTTTVKFSMVVKVTTPHMPILTDGKAPDLTRILGPLGDAVKKAGNKLRSSTVEKEEPQSVRILESLPQAIEKVSGNHLYPFSLRQLYYAIRDLTDLPGLNYGYFGKIITDYEVAIGGDIQGMYRDNRGVLYHPHLAETIPMGTRTVDAYKRPPWTFNRVLYCEKAGFMPLMIGAKWPERNDCALLSGQGYASRAIRDLIDFLGETQEPVQIFCIHDADAAGSLIYETLVEATKARGARTIEIVNLGLDIWEAQEDGLRVESFPEGKHRLPVARYVREQEDDWEEYLQSHRVELNAMTSPEFLEWLDRKMAEYPGGKVIPPSTVLTDTLEASIRNLLMADIRDSILREHDLDALLKERLADIKIQVTPAQVKKSLDRDPERSWRDTIDTLARKAVKS